MRKHMMRALGCAMVLSVAMMTTACGGGSTDESKTPAAQEGQQQDDQTSGVYTVHYGPLFNDDEEQQYVFPFVPMSSAYGEAMMQITGYDFSLDVTDASTYELTFSYECGENTEDTSMYMKRTYVFSGAYTADGDAYTLAAPEHLQFSQNTAGQFAATSGEGGADFWGPDGLSFDETYANENGYNGCDAADILAAFSPCVATVSGDAISSFELTE